MKILKCLKIIFKNIFHFIIDPFVLLIIFWPGLLGVKLRYYYYKKKLIYLGKNVKIDVGVYFQNPRFISIGDNCWIDRGVVILAGRDKSSREKIYLKGNYYSEKPGMVCIGKNVHISIGCIISGIEGGVIIKDNSGLSADSKVYAFTHHYRSRKTPSNKKICFGPLVDHSKQCLIVGPIVIEENVGIALNAILLPGTHINCGSFVTINSVVSGRFNENSIISGNPAEVIAKRFLTKD